MIFFKDGNKLSHVYMNKSVFDFKDKDGAMFAFNDLDEGFLFYESLVNQINNEETLP